MANASSSMSSIPLKVMISPVVWITCLVNLTDEASSLPHPVELHQVVLTCSPQLFLLVYDLKLPGNRRLGVV